jgi:hypothetical protein
MSGHIPLSSSPLLSLCLFSPICLCASVCCLFPSSLLLSLLVLPYRFISHDGPQQSARAHRRAQRIRFFGSCSFIRSLHSAHGNTRRHQRFASNRGCRSGVDHLISLLILHCCRAADRTVTSAIVQSTPARARPNREISPAERRCIGRAAYGTDLLGRQQCRRIGRCSGSAVGSAFGFGRGGRRLIQTREPAFLHSTAQHSSSIAAAQQSARASPQCEQTSAD